MKVMVTGASGQLGFDVMQELNNRNIKCIGVTKQDFDITEHEKVKRFILEEKPECVIHCAAYTNVDKAEEEEKLCYEVNTKATENITKACSEINSKIIYISTDYVFDGSGSLPHEVNETANPLSIYGKSKYKGELKVKENTDKYFIVRTSWVFGAHGNNFVKTMIKLGKEKESLNVVSDQVGSPTYTKDLAKLLCDMAKTEKYGTYHAVNQGYVSWAEFAEIIMKEAGLKCKINYIKSSEYKTKAVRPLNSRLSVKSLEKNGFKLLPSYKEGILKIIEDTKN